MHNYAIYTVFCDVMYSWVKSHMPIFLQKYCIFISKLVIVVINFWKKNVQNFGGHGHENEKFWIHEQQQNIMNYLVNAWF